MHEANDMGRHFATEKVASFEANAETPSHILHVRGSLGSHLPVFDKVTAELALGLFAKVHRLARLIAVQLPAQVKLPAAGALGFSLCRCSKNRVSIVVSDELSASLRYSF